MKTLRNITLADFRRILTALGCEFARTKGGHEAWKRPGLTRTIIFQTHVEPLPEIVVRNAIRDLGITKERFLEVYENL